MNTMFTRFAAGCGKSEHEAHVLARFAQGASITAVGLFSATQATVTFLGRV